MDRQGLRASSETTIAVLPKVAHAFDAFKGGPCKLITPSTEQRYARSESITLPPEACCPSVPSTQAFDPSSLSGRLLPADALTFLVISRFVGLVER